MNLNCLKLRLFSNAHPGPPALPPVITSGANVSVNENVAFARTLTATENLLPAAVTWEKVGGADAALFTLTGAVLALAALDFENPTDANGDNVYEVSLQATSTTTGLKSLVLHMRLTCQDVDESIPVGGTDFEAPPQLAHRELHRTILVAAGDEYIDLQSEVALPYSPPATSWSIGGDQADLLEAQSFGRYVFTPAKRAGLAGSSILVSVQGSNEWGESDLVDLLIIIPANADCRFVSWEGGNDANNGTTPALAWKRTPRSHGFSGTQVTFAPGTVCFYRGKGEKHLSSLHKGPPSYGSLEHAGAPGNPVVYCGTGWGGRAIFDGSDLVTGWEPVTEEEVSGNPNWANIKKLNLTAQGGVIDYPDNLFCGVEDVWPAQTPRPSNLAVNEGLQDTTETQGFYRINYGAGAASPKAYNSTTTRITVVDARIATRFGAVSPVGATGYVWISGNYARPGKIISYDQPSSTIVIEFTVATTLIDTNRITAYSITHHPLQIEVENQFGWSTDRLTIYAWLPSDERTYVARRNRGMSASQSWIIVEGFWWQRYTGKGACAFSNSSASRSTRIVLRDHVITQVRASGKVGIILNNSPAGESSGYFEPLIERVAVLGSNRGGAIRSGGPFIGIEQGTVTSHAQVREAGFGVRYIFIDSYGVDATIDYAGKCYGTHHHHILARNILSPHGNGLSLYAIDETGYCDWNVLEFCSFLNCERPVTSENFDAFHARNNLYRRLILTSSSPGSYLVALFVGEPESVFEESIIVGVGGWTYPSGAAITLGSGRGVTFRKCVIEGATGSPTGTNIKYTFTDNLMVRNVIPAEGSNRIVSGNTVYDGEVEFRGNWDGTIDATMAATLGGYEVGALKMAA